VTHVTRSGRKARYTSATHRRTRVSALSQLKFKGTRMTDTTS